MSYTSFTMIFSSIGEDINANLKDYSLSYSNYIFKIQLETFYLLKSSQGESYFC